MVADLRRLAVRPGTTSPSEEIRVPLGSPLSRCSAVETSNLLVGDAPAGTPADPARNPASQGYTHFCLDVVDIDAEYERLRQEGMTFHGPPPTAEELGSNRIRSIYARDPDGNIVELQEVIDPRVPFHLDRAPLLSSTSSRGESS